MNESARPKKKLTSFQIIILGFSGVILLGTILLMLPFSSQSRTVTPFLDALFTATSAVCVTGLVVCDTATYWSLFGQTVILLLIQIGGMGVITVAAAIAIVSGKKISLMQRSTIQEAIAAPKVGGIVRLTGFIIRTTLLLELIGAAVMAPVFCRDFGVRGLWMALFHSVSAFCNAGFDLMGAKAPYSSMTAYVSDPVVNLTLCALIVVGGLGFLVWRDMARHKWRWSKYQLHTKLVLFTTGVLILGGWLLFFVFERDASMAGLSVPQRVLASLFQSITPRTAGFNTVDMAALSESGNLLTNVFMLIGGSPGSTAGGIKTTTVAVLILSAITSARGRSRVNAFRYSIDRDTLRQACSILMIYLIMAITAILAICALEPITLPQAMFEVNSAIATVGLSMGITASLGIASRIILILLMYAGRIGGLTFVLLFSERRTEPPVDRPNGKILIG